MELTKQVCSLELAQKLKELGVKQESFFKWSNVRTNKEMLWSLYVPPEFNKIPHPDLWVHGVSAYTVAELGEMLPSNYVVIKSKRIGGFEGWELDTKNFELKTLYPADLSADTEADARAKMLVYLLENNLIN